MSKLFYDRIKETSTTTGTGTFTVDGAVTQFKSFASRFAIGDPFYYCIVGQTGSDWETGYGKLTSSTTIERTKVEESSNADALVSFTAGVKDVFVTWIADRANEAQTKGQITAKAASQTMP